MASAVEVMAEHGIKRPDVTIRAAADAGLELAVACVMLMAESGGGRMVWGHDPVDTGGIYAKGAPVTRDNYLAYREAMQAGQIGRQGVGDCQLTSSEFQDRGDQFGGCWDPYANQLAGFAGLADRIRRWGLRDGLRRYNGSGPAAEAYADARMRELDTWRALLAGTTMEDDMPNPADLWNFVLPDPYEGPDHKPADPKPAGVLLGWAATHAAHAMERATAAQAAVDALAGALDAKVQAAVAAALAKGAVDVEVTVHDKTAGGS